MFFNFDGYHFSQRTRLIYFVAIIFHFNGGRQINFNSKLKSKSAFVFFDCDYSKLYSCFHY